ncbi:hypothetical protein A7318_18235 [Pseudomonas lurida]|uniref:hypothetical protein n=1 Tax=Pseudomonas TaxID=286 RepID=UPI0008125AE0|nr:MULTISPECIES: hypothetical protein [Pseudomonas]AOE80442.1 hypothetical protein A7318_18235 [Pseudomonas lurida]WLG26892.1 hypothetical protein PSH68_19050 [Pseudomonas lurida]SAM32944.1 hypothetical protein BN1864_LIB5394:02991 [Pseudomonas sp. 1 R 17]VVN02458.1 hypothetical protein PS663_03407 [Pseudomonas fluorescens]
MKKKEAEGKPSTTLVKTLAVLKELSTCKPRRASERRTGLEKKAELLSKWSLILSGVLLAPPALLGYFKDPAKALSEVVQNAALVAIALSMSLTLLSFVAPIFASAWVLFRWEAVTYENLRGDIIHEQSIANRLRRHGVNALTEAKMWLELKIKRIEARVTWFFGDKTAALGLFATAYVFSEKFGGFPWIQRTLRAGPGLSNIGDTVLLYAAALIFGLSLGAVLIKHIAARYRYQVELIDLSLR